jgi:hypothetical protein
MNRTKIYFNRIVYNSKLNKEIFIINKNRIVNYKSRYNQIRKYNIVKIQPNCIEPNNPEPNDPEPNDPEIDWVLIILCSLTLYLPYVH